MLQIIPLPECPPKQTSGPRKQLGVKQACAQNLIINNYKNVFSEFKELGKWLLVDLINLIGRNQGLARSIVARMLACLKKVKQHRSGRLPGTSDEHWAIVHH